MTLEALRWQQQKDADTLFIWATHIWRLLPEHAGGAVHLEEVVRENN